MQILPLVDAPGVLCGIVGPISPAVTVLQTPGSVFAVEEELAPTIAVKLEAGVGAIEFTAISSGANFGAPGILSGIFSILVGAVTLLEGSRWLLDVEVEFPITTSRS